MEIEVGDYVRFKRGEIRKITGIDEDGHFLVNYNYRNGKWLTNFDVTEITKHSKNIIDLIEIGDFVNELMVEGRDYDMGLSIFYPVYETRVPLEDVKIKTILTYEQYEQNCFRMEE